MYKRSIPGCMSLLLVIIIKNEHSINFYSWTERFNVASSSWFMHEASVIFFTRSHPQSCTYFIVHDIQCFDEPTNQGIFKRSEKSVRASAPLPPIPPHLNFRNIDMQYSPVQIMIVIFPWIKPPSNRKFQAKIYIVL